ncbi:isochorismatase family cysteine hydrolase [Ruicaihuangia caeni]|uniref:isochorismatase family cysteine hydrolase n=1 Tax=Ruicaihuangia caeni TaxID=3042517 RepID=UPI00338F7D1B
MTPWEIDPARSAVLVIDMQRDFVEEGRAMEVPAARGAIPGIRAVCDAARSAGAPVIYTQHVLLDDFDVSPLETAYNPKLRQLGMREGTDGVEIVDELAPMPGEVVIAKHRYDAFHNTRLDSVLRSIRGLNGIDTVIITGTLTEVCCESTARSAFMRDYKVAFVSDATGALLEGAQKATEAVVATFFGRVLTSAQVIDELAAARVG